MEISIGELSRRTRVKAPSIRYYESVALMPAPPRSEGKQRRYGGRARQTVVATAGGLSQDGRRRRSPLATAANHERRRGTLHKHWACPGWPSWMGTAAALGGQKAAAGVRRHAAQIRHSPRTWRDIS
jgi:hypothetical protein